MPKKIRLDDWIERDLSHACAAGELAPAFEVDELLRQVEETLLAGNNRSPVLVGPPGVGKSAVYHALVARLAAGEGPERLRGVRVVQISFNGISGRFPPNTGKATDFAQRFFDHLVTLDPPVLPLIRDVHAAYGLDWEAMLHRYLTRAKLPILAEAQPGPFDEMVEYWSDLTQYLVPIVAREPTVPTVKRIVAQWDAHGAGAGRRPFEPDAQGIAIELTARYMGDRSFPRKVLDLLEQTRVLASKAGDTLGLDTVVDRFSQLTRVPGNLIDPRERLDLDDVNAFLASRLLGQEEAVDAIVRMIALIKAGLTDLRRPFGVLLFVGPTGVGKTHAAQLLAQYLFGDDQRLIRVNMADYANEADVATLFGSPYGQNLAQKRGVLASRLMGHPFGVLLLDEFEKAHPRVHDGFLQLIDEGRFINGMGETVSAASMIIIATSNAGVEVFRETGLGFRPERDVKALDRELDRRLLQTFRFEFLNRFDHVVHFHPLSRAHIRDIARRELGALVKRDGISRRGLVLDFSMDLLDWVVAHGYHPHFGARFLRREIERTVTAALADFVVRTEPVQGAHIELAVRQDRVVVRQVAEPIVVVPGDGDESMLTLTAAELKAEAARQLSLWAALEAEHRQRSDEASALIEASQAKTFWDDPAEAQRTLKRYTSLDARLQADQRLLQPALALRALTEGPRDPDPEALAAAIADARRNHKRWLDLGAHAGPNGAWLLIGPADPTHPPGPWLGQLVTLYGAWCRRRGFTFEVVAEQASGEHPLRVVLEIEGAGVGQVLAMEAGRHTHRQANGRTARARVDVIARSEQAHGARIDGLHISDARQKAGTVLARRSARLSLQVPERGLAWTFNGTDRSTLTLLGQDLHPYLSAGGGTDAVARTYGLKGGAVHDPRTHASHPQIKDVLRGELDPFWRAWERHTAEAAAGEAEAPA